MAEKKPPYYGTNLLGKPVTKEGLEKIRRAAGGSSKGKNPKTSMGRPVAKGALQRLRAQRKSAAAAANPKKAAALARKAAAGNKKKS